MAVLDELLQLLGGGGQPQGDLARIIDRPYSADQGYQQPEQLLPKQDQPHTWDEAVDAWYGLTGIPDIQKGWQTYQEGGDPLAAFGQAGAGALNAASLAFPALKAVPGLARTIGPLLGDEIGALGGARRGSTPFIDQLRAEHLARDNPLPLTGATQPITPPPHIQSMEDMTALTGRSADLSLRGQAAKPWYDESGQSILYHTGGQPDVADAFAGGLAGTSPSTEVAGNMLHGVTAHNQAMAGDPIRAGRFPQVMGNRLERYYYGGEPISGEKIGPFMGATVESWNPNFAHQYVNDFWNMRGAEFPGPEGAIYTQTPTPGTGELYGGTPTLGEHNFTRVLAERARDELQRRTGEAWRPKEVQSTGWGGIKSVVEGSTPEEAAFNFADAMKRNYAQLSWESAPGPSTAQFPEYLAMSPADRQQYHEAIRGVLTDPSGRDVIPAHLGMLVGRTIDAPGFFKGQGAPGSQSLVAAGQAPGGWKAGVDSATRDLLNTSELVRGLLLRQDAVAWHKPSYSAGLVPGSKDANMIEMRLGRSLTTDETTEIAREMQNASGTDFFTPIGTGNGVRFLNVPEYSGLTNKKFAEAVRNVAGRDIFPDSELVHAKADGFYHENDWQRAGNGEDYTGILRAGGRPHLQRAAAELLATLGPRVAEVDRSFGFSPNPAAKVWQGLGGYQQDLVPNPRRPWDLGYPAQRPAPTDALSEILRKLGG